MMQSGTVIAGRFEIVREAGAGGMGLVFRARDHATGEPVAIKLVRSVRDAERFVREAEVLAGLSHAAIVRYVAHGMHGGSAYLAMEWLEGVDLGERLEHSGLTFAESVRLAAATAAALAHAHARSIVHRDIKPSNLFLRGGAIDRVAVLDFGVAHVAAASRRITGTGAVIGTPGYMAPEQARGERAVDARADVFALGCVLFECIAGRPAFVGEHPMALLAKILFEDTPRTRDARATVPGALDALVARMMAKDPALRPPDGAAILAELSALDLSSDAPHAPAPSPASAITGGEQHLISVVMARASADARHDAPTLTPVEAEQADADLALALAVHGGRLERLADGSLVVLVAGAGTAADQAAAAARSALAMRSILGEVAIAVATGRGDLGGRLPVSEAVDRAARLLHDEAEGHGPPPIRLDDMTRGLLDARVRIEGAGDADVSLLGEIEIETQRGARKLLGVATRCVGRERDLAALAGTFEECAAECVAKVVVVTAVAGTGKSRLCHELLQRLRRHGDVAVWLAHGAAISAGSAFGMLVQLVKRAAGVRDAEPRNAWAERIHAHVAARAPALDAARIAEFLCELVGAGGAAPSPLLRAARGDAVFMADQLRRAFVDLVATECAAGPLLIVLEDLHWGDLPTVKAIDAALRTLRDRPLLVLTLARPEVHEVFPRLWEERDAQTIRLGGLSRRAAEGLAAEVLGERASAATVARIVERAGGNAFYLEELIRAVAEGRGDALPETVVAMMQTRLGGLAPELRRVLRAASVFGEVFWRGGVATLLDADAVTLDARLAELTDRELVAPSLEARFGGEREYAFRHAIVREAAYAMLTERDRATGHRLAGGWLEAAGEREAMVLAEHFERGGEPARAVPWFLRAAESALEGGDLDAAIARAERGIAGGAEGEILCTLRTVQGGAYAYQGRFPEALEGALASISRLPEGTVIWAGAVGLAVFVGGYLGRMGEIDAHIGHFEERCGELAFTRSGACTFAGAFNALLITGRYDRARRVLEILAAIEHEKHALEPGAIGWRAWGRMMGALWLDADVGAALDFAESALACFMETGDAWGIATTMFWQASCLMLSGSHAWAEQVLAEAMATSRRIGMRFAEAVTKLFMAAAVARRGELSLALSLLTEAQQSFAMMKCTCLEGLAERSLAQSHLLWGDVEGALSHAKSAVELTTDAPPYHAEALAALAQVRERRGEHVEALSAARAAMAIVGDLGSIGPGEAAVRLRYVQVLNAAGDDDGARAALREASARLAAQVEKIRDPALRRSFIDEVHVHRKTLAMAREWLGATSGPSL